MKEGRKMSAPKGVLPNSTCSHCHFPLAQSNPEVVEAFDVLLKDRDNLSERVKKDHERILEIQHVASRLRAAAAFYRLQAIEGQPLTDDYMKVM